MKKVFAFSILFFWMAAAFANQIITLNLSEVQLDGQQYEKDFFIAEVIDARPEKHCLGFVHKGLTNNRMPIYSQRPLEEELHGFFAKTFENEAGKAAIVLRVNHLFIYEVIYSDREYAFAELNLTFLKKGDSHFTELLEVGTVVEKIGMEVSKRHPLNISNAIAICFKEFNEKRKEGRLQNGEVASTEVRKYPLSGKDYPVLHAHSASPGIYKTFNDFRQNEPRQMAGYKPDYYREKDNNVVVADLIWDKNIPKEDRLVWGFNDGSNDFIRIGTSFYQVNKTADGFRVMAPVVKSNNGMVTGAAVGGIIGGIIGGLIDAASVKYSEYQLDFVTGSILPIEEPIYRKIESRLYLCSSRFSKGEIALEIDGKEVCRLNTGEYVKLAFPPETTSVNLCVASENGRTCEAVSLELFNRTTYLLISYKNKPPKIDLPNKNLLAELNHEIRDGKFVPVCND